MSKKSVIIIILLGVGVGCYLVAKVRHANRVLTAEGPVGFGLIFEDCPKCGHHVDLSPGKTARCESCGKSFASCESCGKTLEGPEVARHVPGAAWLCKQHREEANWESARLEEFGTEEALRPPADSPRALGTRRYYEIQIRDAFSKKKQTAEVLFAFGKRQRVDSSEAGARGWPERVVEAYRFYERAVMNRDNGTVGIFQWDFEGSPLYLAQCSTDGSDGYLEIYDVDGTALGYARTDWGCPAWTSKGAVRRRAFTGDRDEVDVQVADAVKRLRGDSP
jgi:hypothetical protein